MERSLACAAANFELATDGGKLSTSHVVPSHPGLPGMKRKNLSYHLGADRRPFLLLFTQIAPNSGKGFS
jgi:hypothetical protein